MAKEKISDANVENIVRFMLAGVSNMTAASITNPIDVVKIRMQLDNELSQKVAMSQRSYRGIFRGIYKIATEEGLRGLYKGLPASLMREGSYSTIRMGAYEPMKKLFGATDPAHTPLWKKFCAGAVSGALGSALATPTDLVKVRQQAERPGQVRRYPGTAQAFVHIYRESGARGLYVGLVPTVQRATILTATQIPTYDHTKHTILNLGWLPEGPRLHIVSSMCAGFMSALTTSPVDVIKTRVMNQQSKDKYANAWRCLIQTIRAEGVLGLYKGFIPNWLRIGPHTIITFFIFERLRRLSGIDPI